MVRTFEGGHLNMSGEGRMYPRYDPDIHGFIALPPFGKGRRDHQVVDLPLVTVLVTVLVTCVSDGVSDGEW